MNIIQKFISQFFNRGHERSIAAKKNIAASFLIKSISIAINLALVPMTIHYINPSQYGIWLTLSSIIAWFSFFDIGFGNGLRNRFAEAKAIGNFEKAHNYISTTYAVLIIIFIIVWVLFWIINFFIDWSYILNAPSNMAGELSSLAIIVFSFFCLQIVLKIINVILIADQKPAKAAFFDMLGQLIALIIIFILTKTTNGSLIYLGLGMGVAPILVLIISSIWFYSGKYNYIAPTIKKIQFSLAKDIASLGFKFFFIQISAIIIFQTSNIVISQILGPEHVTTYNIEYKYFSLISMTFIMILSPFWSAFTEAYTKEDYHWMQNSILQLKKIWIFLIPVSLIMIMLAKTAFKIWIGDRSIISNSTTTSIFMGIYILIYARSAMFVYLINGIGKIRLQLYINLIICIIYIPTSIFACKWYGINGIIVENIFVVSIHAVISQTQIKLLMNNKATGIWNK